VAADGVLSAPEYTRTCICPYQNQTSLALVTMPDAEVWTISDFARHLREGGRIQRAGINLGGPGQRRSPEGTLWLEYPVRSSALPLGFAVTVSGEKVAYFNRHPSSIVAGPLPWVACSGAKSVETVSIALVTPSGPRPEIKPAPYTIRLVFSEPDGLAPGQRTFDVSLQGEKVADHFDIAKTAGGPCRSVVREFPGIPARDAIKIELRPSPGCQAPTVLCGVEVIAEKAAQ
jgi:hypothetical protein